MIKKNKKLFQDDLARRFSILSGLGPVIHRKIEIERETERDRERQREKEKEIERKRERERERERKRVRVEIFYAIERRRKKERRTESGNLCSQSHETLLRPSVSPLHPLLRSPSISFLSLISPLIYLYFQS